MTKIIKVLGDDFEMETIGVDKGYGYAESDELPTLASIMEEVEKQGCETNLRKGTEKKYRLEFTL